MSRHHKLLIVATFGMGILTGVFGFFMSGGRGESEVSDVSTKGYEVSVTEYGVCEAIGCPSYRLDQTGAYEYLAVSDDGAYERFSDVLTKRARDTISRLITRADLETLDRESHDAVCPSQNDLVVYRMDVRVEDQFYSLDSCASALLDDPLVKELIVYSNIFRTTYER